MTEEKDHALLCLQAQLGMQEQELKRGQIRMEDLEKSMAIQSKDNGIVRANIKSLKSAITLLKLAREGEARK